MGEMSYFYRVEGRTCCCIEQMTAGVQLMTLQSIRLATSKCIKINTIIIVLHLHTTV